MEYDLTEYGHVGVFGASGSGKTTYIKTLLGKIGVAGNKVHVYTTTGYQWSDFTVHENFDDIGDVVSEANRTKKDGKTVIVFDDFNEVINTQTDPRYIGLFTHGRHAGIIVINGAHAPTSMGAKARKQLKYTVVMNTSDMETLNALSNYYLLGDSDKLIKHMDRKPDKYTACVIENETRQLHYDKSSGTDGGGVNNSIGNKSYSNCKVMDQSSNNYNINQNIEIKNMIEANSLKNELSIVNYNHRLELKKLENQDELMNLIMKFAKSREDHNRLISLLNVFITNYSVDQSNYKEYIQPFMNHYYPDCNYKTGDSNKMQNLIEDNVVDLYNGDYQSMLIAGGLKYGVPLLDRFNVF